MKIPLVQIMEGHRVIFPAFCNKLILFEKILLGISSECQTVWTQIRPYKNVVVVFVFNVPPTAKVIWRQGHGYKSHPTDW